MNIAYHMYMLYIYMYMYMVLDLFMYMYMYMCVHVIWYIVAVLEMSDVYVVQIRIIVVRKNN